jgi:hypothetical protein
VLDTSNLIKSLLLREVELLLFWRSELSSFGFFVNAIKKPERIQPQIDNPMLSIDTMDWDWKAIQAENTPAKTNLSLPEIFFKCLNEKNSTSNSKSK